MTLPNRARPSTDAVEDYNRVKGTANLHNHGLPAANAARAADISLVMDAALIASSNRTAASATLPGPHYLDGVIENSLRDENSALMHSSADIRRTGRRQLALQADESWRGGLAALRKEPGPPIYATTRGDLLLSNAEFAKSTFQELGESLRTLNGLRTDVFQSLFFLQTSGEYFKADTGAIDNFLRTNPADPLATLVQEKQPCAAVFAAGMKEIDAKERSLYDGLAATYFDSLSLMQALFRGWDRMGESAGMPPLDLPQKWDRDPLDPTKFDKSKFIADGSGKLSGAPQKPVEAPSVAVDLLSSNADYADSVIALLRTKSELLDEIDDFLGELAAQLEGIEERLKSELQDVMQHAIDERMTEHSFAFNFGQKKEYIDNTMKLAADLRKKIGDIRKGALMDDKKALQEALDEGADKPNLRNCQKSIRALSDQATTTARGMMKK